MMSLNQRMSVSKRCLPGNSLIQCGRSEEQLNTVFASALSGDPARNNIGIFTQSLEPQSGSASCLLVRLSFITFSLATLATPRGSHANKQRSLLCW